MRAYELIDKMRSRLRDEAEEGWSDVELLDAINLSLSAIAHDFLPWKGRWTTVTSPGVDTYSLPEDFMAPIAVIIGGIPMEISGTEWSLSGQSEDDPCVFMDGDALIVYPSPSVVADLVVNYHAIHQIITTADMLRIPTDMADVLLYYAMSQALQKEPSEDALNKSTHYLSLYKDRKNTVSKMAHRRRSQSATTSRYQKV